MLRALRWQALLALAIGANAAPPLAIVRNAQDPAIHLVRGALVVDGVPFTGELVDRYPNGQWIYQRSFRDGREDGVHTGWWEDGRLHFVYTYSNGVLEGEAREWYRDGSPYRVFHYVAGHETGLQQMWYADGGLRASYEVREGRRYGLPGAKGCTGMSSTVSNP